MKPETKRKLAYFLTLLAVVSGFITIIVFATGKNLPDFFAPARPADGVEPSKSPLPTNDEAAQQVRSIVLPDHVFDFRSLDNQTRGSYLLSPEEVGAGAWAYGYWEDSDSIWMDATAGSGAAAVRVTTQKRSEYVESSQKTLRSGATTCAWDQDSDPNTPMHTVKCVRIDEARQLVLIVWTETRSVGDNDPARLAEQIWNSMSVS